MKSQTVVIQICNQQFAVVSDNGPAPQDNSHISATTQANVTAKETVYVAKTLLEKAKDDNSLILPFWTTVKHHLDGLRAPAEMPLGHRTQIRMPTTQILLQSDYIT